MTVRIEIRNTLEALEKGKTILYPTDTMWGIGCDATNAEAVEKVYALKKRSRDKPLLCLVSDIIMLRDYLESIPEAAFDVIAFSNQPTTIIYPCPSGIAENLKASDGSVGFRIVNENFCQELIKKFGKPIVATSANVSGRPIPQSFRTIEDEIIEGVEHVVNLHLSKKYAHPSTVIKVENDNTTTTIRE